MDDDRALADMADRWLRVRRCRERFFPHEMFDEFAWDMLMVLFVADAKGRAIGIDDLIAQTTGRTPSGMRWIAYLEQQGEIARTEVPDGTTVSLTPASRERMRDFLRTAIADVGPANLAG